jgi:hypothetical protein
MNRDRHPNPPGTAAAVTEGTVQAPGDTTFDPALLATDLDEICRIYADLFATMDATRWDEPVKRGRNEWTLHETIAHLCALNGAGLDSVIHSLRAEPYVFDGLDTRYQLNGYNRKGIDDHLDKAPAELCAEFLRVHGETAEITAKLRPEQAELTFPMAIYNRPVQIIEALSIITFHAGLVHTAQVAEPAGVPPLWTRLSPQVRRRQIGRAMRAFSLLYRHEIGDPLRTTFAFRVDGPGGGVWHVDVAPEGATAGEGHATRPGLTLRFRETDDFCRMMTVRLNAPLALVTRRLRLRGDLRLFRRMSKLFSVDATP